MKMKLYTCIWHIVFKNIFKQIDPIALIKNEIKIINNNSKDFACFMLITAIYVAHSEYSILKLP